MDRMKKIKKLLVVSVFLCFMALGTAVVQAKPAVSGTTKMETFSDLSNPKSLKFYLSGQIFITGVSKDAKVYVTSCTSKQVDPDPSIVPSFLDGEERDAEDEEDDEEDAEQDEFYQQELANFKNVCTITIMTEEMSMKKLSLSDFTVKIKVKQGGKDYNLQTTCKAEGYKAFKKIKVNGKNITKKFSPYFRVYSMKLAGKKLKISYKMNKGYRKAGVVISRKGKPLSVKKAGKLKKGDLIHIEFLKKGWQKSDAFTILVK